MASLWHNLIGRARPVPASQGARVRVRAPEFGPARRYLAVVTRERPDLLLRVNRLFFSDGNVDAILDRRYGERRRLSMVGGVARERRRGERRRDRALEPEQSIGPVAIVEATGTAVRQRVLRWIAAGQDALGALDQVVGEATALEREADALRASVGHLQTENERLREENATLRARAAATSRGLAELTEHIVRPLGEIVHRLREP